MHNHFTPSIKQVSRHFPRVSPLCFHKFPPPPPSTLHPFTLFSTLFLVFSFSVQTPNLFFCAAMADIQYQYPPQQHQTDPYDKNYYQENAGPSTSKILAVAALLPLGGTLLALAGLSLVATLIGLAITTPLFLLFSPVLVPAAFVIGLSVAGFLTSGAFGITGLSSLSWIARYLHLTGTAGSSGPYNFPQQFDQAKRHAHDAAGQLGQRTREVGQKVHNRSQEVGRTAAESGRDQETGRNQEATTGKK